MGESLNPNPTPLIQNTPDSPSHLASTGAPPMPSSSTFDGLLRGHFMVVKNYLLTGHIGRKIVLPGDWERLDTEDDDDIYHHALAANLEAMTAVQMGKERFYRMRGAYSEL